MNYESKLIEMQVAAEDAATNLELTSLFAEAQIVKNLPANASSEIRSLNTVLLKTMVEADLAKGRLLHALGLPLNTRLVNPPSVSTG